MRPLLIVGTTSGDADLTYGRRREDIEVARVPALPAPGAIDRDRPTVIVVDTVLLATVHDPERRLAELARTCAIVGRGQAWEQEPSVGLPASLFTAFVPGGASSTTMRSAVHGAFRHALALHGERRARREAERRRRELGELAEVGVALANERDLSRLLTLVLSQARRLTTCDAASLYLVERGDDGAPASLRFKLTQNHSRPDLAFEEFSLPVDATSLAGHVALTGEALCIADVATLGPEVPYAVNRSFDHRTGYRTKSMLVLPLTTHRDEVIGVLQLINRKRDAGAVLCDAEVAEREVMPFTLDAMEPANALAAHAAVAIENGILYESIERLFEGLVTAAVTAIESRDPATSGHSARVAALTVGLAEALEQAPGRYAGVRFSAEQLREIRYAALLHDFGKVAVPEAVLVKGAKLYPADLERIRARMELLIAREDQYFEAARADRLLRHGQYDYERTIEALAAGRDARAASLRSFLADVECANAGDPPYRDDAARLTALVSRRFRDGRGNEHALVLPEEAELLTIPRGTLDATERRLLESHVAHSYRFLQAIPWTRQLAGIPEIAYAHHEKLNGTGYPRGLREAEIPLAARIMAIADVYDALTSADRSYRAAASPVLALDILQSEAMAGELDLELLTVFRERRVYEITSPERWIAAREARVALALASDAPLPTRTAAGAQRPGSPS